MASSISFLLTRSFIDNVQAGQSGAYDGGSLAWKFTIAFFAGLTLYNAIELYILIFTSFTSYRGLYFWSLLVSCIGLVPYVLGFAFKFFAVLPTAVELVSVSFLIVGWMLVVTGSNVVLWSRLHLIVSPSERGDRVLKYTKWTIIGGAIMFHFPVTVVVYLSNSHPSNQTYTHTYNVLERFQMTGFFLQECVLSSIYVYHTVKILKDSLRPQTKRLMYQLFALNIVIIFMDTALLIIEYFGLFILEVAIKGLIYSIKLKLEFAILSRLVQFVGGDDRRESTPSQESRSMTFIEIDKPDVKGGRSSRQGSVKINKDPYDISEFLYSTV